MQHTPSIRHIRGEASQMTAAFEAKQGWHRCGFDSGNKQATTHAMDVTQCGFRKTSRKGNGEQESLNNLRASSPELSSHCSCSLLQKKNKANKQRASTTHKWIHEYLDTQKEARLGLFDISLVPCPLPSVVLVFLLAPYSQ